MCNLPNSNISCSTTIVISRNRASSAGLVIEDYFFRNCELIADGILRKGLLALWIETTGKLTAVSLLPGSVSCFISPHVLRLLTLAILSMLPAFIGICLLLYLSYSANKLTFRMNE